MDVSCNCFGVATAAKVPVKRYNLLVPAIFPVSEPIYDKPLSISTEKNIKRLGEYLERNEHRIPKVSRRLARRLQSDLSKRKLGFVHIAVAAYIQLLSSDNTRLGRLYAKEIIVRYPPKKQHIWSLTRGSPLGRLPPSSAHLGSVVGVLLSSPDPTPQQWGLDLLIKFLKLQFSAEFIVQLEAFVPLLCEKACHGRDHVPSLSLQAVLEHLRLCSRIAYVSRHLDVITNAVLNILDSNADHLSRNIQMREHIHRVICAYRETQQMAEGDGALAPRSGSRRTAPGGASGSPALLSKLSIGNQVGESSSSCFAALLVYAELGHMTRDAAEGKKVLQFLIGFLDQKPDRWLGSPALEYGMELMREACTQEHQRYLLASLLFAHTGISHDAAELTAKHRMAVLQQALIDSSVLEEGLAAPALLLSLQELPKALLVQPSPRDVPGDRAQFHQAVLHAVHAMAQRIGSRLQLTSVLGAVLARTSTPTPLSIAALKCSAAASAAYSTLAKPLTPTPSQYLSNVLLRSTLGICLSWASQERVLAHEILHHALHGVPEGSYSQQVHLLLSALWHELVGIENKTVAAENQPCNYVAIDKTFAAVVKATKDPSCFSMACKFVLALQEFVLHDQHHDLQTGKVEAINQSAGSRNAPIYSNAPTVTASDVAINNQEKSMVGNGKSTTGHSEAQRIAIVLLCNSMWQQLDNLASSLDLKRLAIAPLPYLESISLGAQGLEYSSSVFMPADLMTSFDVNAFSLPLMSLALSVISSYPGYKKIVQDDDQQFVVLPGSSILPNIILQQNGNGVEQAKSPASKRLVQLFSKGSAEADSVTRRMSLPMLNGKENSDAPLDKAAGDEEESFMVSNGVFGVVEGGVTMSSIAQVLEYVGPRLKSS